MRYQLLPLAMRVPNSDGIYAPSNLESAKEISIADFEKYISREIKVSFHKDGVSNPQLMTAYGYCMDCWYLVEMI